ncbi:hypothetical protein NLJ89_g6949 [Agrocybe chaxingu]|uniref:F-box domain-containing protein n=1 Tax=Agrocybe chaxingu TaxID=84603 RepID=A0A9W8K5G0_9AGAR|nr:hypothetical protein NLJ89_g6949 [Agrocybe chaxingu]
MIDALPQEIIDTIIATLPRILAEKDAKQSLKACALVSRSFSHPARRCLWSKIRLAGHPAARANSRPEFSGEQIMLNMHEMRRMLLETDVVAFVRTLHIDVGETRRILDEANQMHSILDTLASMGTNIDTFWITGHPQRPFRWNNVPTKTVQSILSLLKQSPNLVNLRFSNITNLPLSVPTSIPAIRSLELNRTVLVLSDGSRALGRLPDSPLHRLDYLCIHRFINRLVADYPSLITENITRFKVSVLDPNEALLAWKIISHTSRYLRCLDLMLRTGPPFLLTSPIDISDLPALHTLNLYIQTGSQVTIPSLDDIFGLLDPRSRPTSLERLSVFFNCVAPHTLPVYLINILDESWQLLHPDVLREKHQRLKSVAVDLDLHVNPSGTVQRRLSHIEAILKDNIWAAIFPSDDPLPAPQVCAFEIFVKARS